MSSPMGSSESQKLVFMSWVQTLRTLKSSRIIGCEDSQGLELLGSCEFLMSNVQRCADNFALRRVSSIQYLPQSNILNGKQSVLLVFEGFP